MIGEYPSEVARTVGALLAPFITVFGLYVIAHGHYGPGGGFAGGVLLAVGPVLLRLSVGESSERWFPAGAMMAIALAGFGAFAVIGLVPVAAGGAFLDYAAVEIGELAASRVRYLGILAVEIAVGFAVAGTIVAIFDAVAGERPAGERPGHEQGEGERP